jgi:uncharacterized membrane protein HdeD (DUF308 family)
METDSMTDDARDPSASRGSRWLRVVVGVAANIIGLLCVIWPTLPQQWGVWEFVGYLFNASKDPSMGIQYMFFWLLTVPFGGLLSYLGTKTATGSGGLAGVVALAVVGGGVQLMWWIAGVR